MVTVNEIGGKTNSQKILQLVGLSTDEKPKDVIDDHTIGNGSTYFEMDTGFVYMFDIKEKRWYKL